MGGKGGGGNPMPEPVDTSGYATPEQAAATLAAQAPLDLSGMQQSIDVQKAAAAATAPPVIPTVDPNQGASTGDTGNVAASSVLAPPQYWSANTLQPQAATDKGSAKTTQT
jgi:hypothetical protein